MAFDDLHVKVQVFQRISDIDPRDWNRLSGERPFQSHRWHQYGEQVMSDCKPMYLLAYRNGVLSARASLWLIRNEPLPEMPILARKALMLFFRHWPLLICRSPLAYTHGVMVSDHEQQHEIIQALSNAALSIARQQGASFLMFDYLNKADAQVYSNSFNTLSVPNPGTIMENKWDSFDDYLAQGTGKSRRKYGHRLRAAEDLGIKITRHTRVEQVEEALKLIREVEDAYESPHNPWAQGMLENMEMVNGTFLAATIDERLVGCILLVEDNSAQMACLLGHARNTPYVYFAILYESLKVAFEHHLRLLRWGSGVYEVKQHLGFSLEDNNSFALAAAHPLLQKIIRHFS